MSHQYAFHKKEEIEWEHVPASSAGNMQNLVDIYFYCGLYTKFTLSYGPIIHLYRPKASVSPICLFGEKHNNQVAGSIW